MSHEQQCVVYICVKCPYAGSISYRLPQTTRYPMFSRSIWFFSFFNHRISYMKYSMVYAIELTTSSLTDWVSIWLSNNPDNSYIYTVHIQRTYTHFWPLSIYFSICLQYYIEVLRERLSHRVVKMAAEREKKAIKRNVITVKCIYKQTSFFFFFFLFSDTVDIIQNVSAQKQMKINK